MTAIGCFTPSSAYVEARRLFDTAVTASDCSIEKATMREYDGSLPTSVMSVPCSVVTTFGPSPSALRICLDRNAAVACGTA